MEDPENRSEDEEEEFIVCKINWGIVLGVEFSQVVVSRI
jgi:hypothetical protein